MPIAVYNPEEASGERGQPLLTFRLPFGQSESGPDANSCSSEAS